MRHFKNINEWKETEYKHVFFDMDGTVTRAKSLITPEMTEALLILKKKHDVIIVSGQTSLDRLRISLRIIFVKTGITRLTRFPEKNFGKMNSPTRRKPKSWAISILYRAPGRLKTKTI